MFYIKRFSKEIVFKFSKNAELKSANDPKPGQHGEWKMENNCHGVKNAKFEFAIKCSFSKINSAFFCRALLKVVLKYFKGMLLLHLFDGFFHFLN